MHYIARYIDNSQFGSRQGYWEESPDTGIAQLEIEFPFIIHRKNDDGSLQAIEPSRIAISGYDEYYLWNRAKSSTALNASNVVGTTTEYLGMAMAGVDRAKNIVSYFEVDNIGNVTGSIFTIEEFMEKYKPSEKGVRKGIVHG